MRIDANHLRLAIASDIRDEKQLDCVAPASLKATLLLTFPLIDAIPADDSCEPELLLDPHAATVRSKFEVSKQVK